MGNAPCPDPYVVMQQQPQLYDHYRPADDLISHY